MPFRDEGKTGYERYFVIVKGIPINNYITGNKKVSPRAFH